MTTAFPCPCCGFLTLSERAVYEICPVCFWEDDGQDSATADIRYGGPNRVSLTTARRNYLRMGVAEEKDLRHVRPPQGDEAQHRWFTELGGNIVEAVRIEVLPGLPPYGPSPTRFGPGEWNVSSEGYIVQFETATGTDWTGNFQPGSAGVSAVHRHPDGRHAVVFSQGQGYVVDPETAQVSAHLGDGVRFVVPCPAANALALCDHIYLTVLYGDGTTWEPGRISWDGIENVQLDGTRLHGEACDPLNGDIWVPFSADLIEQEVTGGSWPQAPTRD